MPPKGAFAPTTVIMGRVGEGWSLVLRVFTDKNGHRQEADREDLALNARSARWAAAAVLIVGTAGLIWKLNMPDMNPPVDRPITINDLVPAPAHVEAVAEVSFEITEKTGIRASAGAAVVGDYLATLLRASTGYPLPVASDAGAISLRLDEGAMSSFGGEGYGLDVSADGVVIEAGSAAGLFHGVQTLRQLLPAVAASRAATAPMPGRGRCRAFASRDEPRFALPRRHARRRPALLRRGRREARASTWPRCTRSTTCTCTSPTTRAGGSRSTPGRG